MEGRPMKSLYGVRGNVILCCRDAERIYRRPAFKSNCITLRKASKMKMTPDNAANHVGARLDDAFIYARKKFSTVEESTRKTML